MVLLSMVLLSMVLLSMVFETSTALFMVLSRRDVISINFGSEFSRLNNGSFECTPSSALHGSISVPYISDIIRACNAELTSSRPRVAREIAFHSCVELTRI